MDYSQVSYLVFYWIHLNLDLEAYTVTDIYEIIIQVRLQG